MYAIAGAILLNAACVLMTSTKDEPGFYSMRLMLLTFGGGFIGADLQWRLRECFQKAHSQSNA